MSDVTPKTESHGTICKCGLAKSYHYGTVRAATGVGHEYDPRYPVTPKTESAARDELIEWNRRNLHAEEPYFTDLIDRACAEAASAAVAEMRDAIIAGKKAGDDFDATMERVAALIASEPKP